LFGCIAITWLDFKSWGNGIDNTNAIECIQGLWQQLLHEFSIQLCIKFRRTHLQIGDGSIPSSRKMFPGVIFL
jgi:hypothetical protein